MKRYLHKISIILIPIILTLYFYPLKRDKPIEIKSHSHTTSESVNLIELSSKNTGFQLHAEKVELYDNPENLICSNVICKILSQNKNVAQINSSKTIMNTKTKDLFLEGNITGSFDVLELKGFDFSYNFTKEKIETNHQSELIHPYFRISSQKLVIELDNKIATFSNNVKSEFYIKTILN